MHQYIADTEFAVSSILGVLTHDRATLDALEVEQRQALAKETCFDIAFLQRQMHPSANYWYGQLMEAQGTRNALDSRIAQLQTQILDKRFSLAALAGAVLQIAKQGISIVRRHPDSCPSGRALYGVPLKWVVWAGRNQSQHFETPKLVDDTTFEVFSALAAGGAGELFRAAREGQNLAYEVLSALGWSSFEAYSEDLVSLLG